MRFVIFSLFPVSLGRAESLAEGRVEGKDEANRENVKRMKDKGYSIADIADITGLTEEMIEQL